MKRLIVLAALAAGCGAAPEKPRHDRMLWEAQAGGIIHADTERVVLWQSPRLEGRSAARGTVVWAVDLRGVPEHVAGPTVVYRSSDSQETVVALDVSDGRERWRTFAKDYAKLFVAGGRCWLSERNGTLHSVDGFTGNTLCKLETRTLLSSLAIDATRVYAMDAEGALTAHPLEGGKLIWKREIGQTLDPIAVVGSRVLVNSGTLGRKLEALDAASGNSVWTWDRPASPTGTWIHGSGLLYYIVGATVHAVDVATGARLWERITHASPVPGDGAVYIAAFDTLTALDARSGKPRWERAGFSRALCADAGFVVASSDRRVVVMEASSGQKRWEFDMASEVRWARRCGPLLVVESYDKPASGAPVRHAVAVLRVE